MRVRLTLLPALLSAAAGALISAANAAGNGVELSRIDVDDYDYSSLQRGARLFMNYCIGCHGLRYARYKRIAEDLKIPEEVFESNLISGEAKLSNYVMSSVEADDARRWFNQAAPPDLTLVSRVRGPDWINTFLRSYYYDEHSLTGWNNRVFENTAMPHVLHGLQGVRTLADDGESYEPVSKGTLDKAGYAAAVRDVTNFLAYVGDPGRHFRIRTGIYVLLFLLVLIVYTHLLYREYWKDIK